jgi:hypothetical protein
VCECAVVALPMCTYHADRSVVTERAVTVKDCFNVRKANLHRSSVSTRVDAVGFFSNLGHARSSLGCKQSRTVAPEQVWGLESGIRTLVDLP